MSLVINSNIASLNALRNLNRSQGSLATSLQRLSSGLRINSAKDDASGLAIAEGLSTKIRGNKQAIRNAGDGISLGQTAETALGQVSAYLQRAREIAIQSANGSIGDNNRAQLQKEVDQLTQEASRIVQTTTFNGTALLSGSSTLTFQVGYEGVSNNQVAITTTDLTGLQGPASTLYEGVAITGYAQAAAADDGIKDLAINGVAIKGPDISGVYERFNPDSSALERATELATAINSFTGSTGVRAELNSTNDGVNLISDTGTDIIVSSDTQSASDIRNWFGLELGTYTSTTNPGTPSVLTSYNSNLSGTGTIDVSTQANATAALTSLDADITNITNTRATFGALQNRFEAVIANLQANSESYTAARSRIQDADFAVETASLTRNQILQQAGVSILSQANSMPQIALSLLS
jgi:flagellin